MKFLRILSLLLALAMLVPCITSCGDTGSSYNEPDDDDDDKDGGKSTDSKDGGTDGSWGDLIDGSKKYVIATDISFAPFEFTNKGELVGIDVELLAAIAEDQGFKYELKALGFNAAVISLETGQADAVIAGMTIDDVRKEKYTFSEPYYNCGISLAVSANNTSITDYSDLRGKVVAVKNSTVEHIFAESIKDTYGFSIQTYEDSALMYEAVKSNKAVACFEDDAVMAYGITQGNGFKIVKTEPTGSAYGFAVLKGAGNDKLVEMFNRGLANIKANGKYREILDRYLAASK